MRPDLDSIRGGDTLSFRCAIPVTLKYFQGLGSDSGMIDMSGASNFRTDMHFGIIAGMNTIIPAVDSFLVIPQIGSISENPTAQNFAKTVTFAQIDSNYQFACQFVALKSGIYYICIIDVLQAEKGCNKASVAITFQNTNQHLHYSQTIYFGGSPVDPIDQRISYCFKVY
jgi:hypothetical protein